MKGRYTLQGPHIDHPHFPNWSTDHPERRNQSGEKCIVKSIGGYWRLKNEADILKRPQSRTRFLRPLIDEIHDPADPCSIVLRYLDNDVLTESNKKRLSRPEIKQVAWCILEVLHLIHKDGMVHTDVKLDNVFVNYGQRPLSAAPRSPSNCPGEPRPTYGRLGPPCLASCLAVDTTCSTPYRQCRAGQ